MTTTPAHDTLTAVLTNTSSDYLDNRFGMSASVEEIADGILRAHAAEVRATALINAAADFERRCPDNGAADALELCMCHAADELRRMAAAARPDNTGA